MSTETWKTMTTNIERAAAEIRRVDGNHTLGAGALAQALADAGLLMPDLPEPHTFLGGDREWHVLDGFVNLNTDGTITVVYDERDEDDIAAGAEIASGEMVFTKPVAARDLVLAFLAATNHAEKENKHE